MKTKLKFAVLCIILVLMIALVSCSFKGCEGIGNSLNPNFHKHTVVIDEAIAATCKTTGLTEGKHCSECGEILVAQEFVIPQHNFVRNTTTNIFSCEGCGASIYNGHIYATFDVYMNWFDAYEYCESLGGHLVTITSEDEQVFVNRMITNAKYPEGIVNGYYFWAGGLYEGQWKWITNEQMTYTNWGSKEPDNSGYTYQWFMALASNIVDSGNMHLEVGDWDDRNHFKDGLYGVICEWELNIEESEHYFTDWKTVTQENCFVSGEKSRQCTHCGLVETQSVEMIEHSFSFNEATGITSCEHCGAAKYNGRIYMIFTSTTNWFTAQANCTKIGGHLLSITSSEEQTFIENYMRSRSFTGYAWMGGYTDGEKWQWVTGEPFEYTNWCANKPDCSGGAEFFTHINYSEFGLWNDFSMHGYNQYGEVVAYICEWETE